MNETNCLICNQKTDYFDEYKFNVNSDIEFFGKIQIVYCKECDLSFADPMPSISKLDHFYKYVYRDFGRPHYKEIINLEALSPLLSGIKGIDLSFNTLTIRKVNLFVVVPSFKIRLEPTKLT